MLLFGPAPWEAVIRGAQPKEQKEDSLRLAWPCRLFVSVGSENLDSCPILFGLRGIRNLWPKQLPKAEFPEFQSFVCSFHSFYCISIPPEDVSFTKYFQLLQNLSNV